MSRTRSLSKSTKAIKEVIDISDDSDDGIEIVSGAKPPQIPPVKVLDLVHGATPAVDEEYVASPQDRPSLWKFPRSYFDDDINDRPTFTWTWDASGYCVDYND